MMEQIELRPGYRISRLIKGGWQLAGGHGDIDREAALGDMTAYVEAGLTAFDCADIYTGVEDMIGAWRASASPETRAQVKVHTKFVPDLSLLSSITRADVRRLIQRSQHRLGQERLDLVQFHWWDHAVPRHVEVAQWLGELQAEGLIDLLGGTNFDAPTTQAMIDAGVRLATMQVQYSVLDARPAGAMSALCVQHGLKFLCYGTVAGGFLSERWLGVPEPGLDPDAPLGNRSLVKYKLIIDDCGGWNWFQALLTTLARVGARHGQGIAAVATRHVLDQPHVATAIVGVRNRAHLAAHSGLFGWALTVQDRLDIATVLAQRVPLAGDIYALERDRTGRHGRIMKYDLSLPTN